MHPKVFIFLLCSLLSALAGCEKRASTQPVTSAPRKLGPVKVDVCGLITKGEIEAIQGSPITDTKSSVHSDGDFRVSQCFYTAAEFSKSINLTVTQSNPDSPAKRTPKDFWRETFGRYSNEEKEREGDKEKRESLREQNRDQGEEEQSIPPKKINDVGDEAYWIGNRVGGALYVLKTDLLIRISIGGADNEETKINKLKALTQKALERL